jgi:hypothetical protein
LPSIHSQYSIWLGVTVTKNKKNKNISFAIKTQIKQKGEQPIDLHNQNPNQPKILKLRSEKPRAQSQQQTHRDPQANRESTPPQPHRAQEQIHRDLP